jgi:multiple sugar transport system substrate-binding protein
MRKHPLIGALALATVLALAACSPSSGGGDSTGDATGGEQAEITFTFWDPNFAAGFQPAVDLFMEQNPDIKVNYVTTPSAEYWTTIQTQIGAGSGPDVFLLNAINFSYYAANGALLPLDDLNIDTSKYPAAMIDMYSYDGTLYAVPNNYDTIGVFYNRRLFDEAGIPYPTAGWTWDDFKAAVAATTNVEEGVYGTASAPYGQMTYYNTIYQAGGTTVSNGVTGFGTPAAIAGVEIWTDFIDQGYSPTLAQITDAWPGDSFGDGKIAMFWDGSWAVQTYLNSAEGANIDVAPMPMGPVNDHCVIHGVAAGVNANTPYPEAAKKFAAFISDYEAALLMAQSGVAIPAYTGTQATWVEANSGMNAQIFLDEALVADPYPMSLNGAAWGAVEGEYISAIFARTMDAAVGMPEMAAKVQALLDAE